MTAESLSNSELARLLVEEVRSAALATLEEGGGPFASYVVTAPSPNGSPLMLLSRLAAHSRNLARDPRASLLLVREPDAAAETMAAIRLTLTGRLLREEDPELKRVFLSRNAEAATYAGFADFSLYRFEIGAGHLVAGFGRIVRLDAADILMRDPQPVRPLP
jgi:putative heme iron utilization protein